jgi:hypothetical protein
MLLELENLLILQKIDNKIYDIENFLSVIPGNILKLQNEFEKKNQELRELSEKLSEAKNEKLQLEKEYEQKKNLLMNAQKKLSVVKNNKEYEAVLKELDTLKKELNNAEYKILELSDTIEDLKKSSKSVEDEYNKIKQSLEEHKSSKEEMDKDKIAELETLKKKREDAEKNIKKQLLGKYETIRKARNNLAIVRVEKETCTGCYMKIPPQLYVEVKKNISIHQCPICQRFLYFTEEESE